MYCEPSYWISSAEESLAIARDIGWQSGEAFALFALAATNTMRGNYGRAPGEGRDMLMIAERIGHWGWQAAALQLLGSIWLDLLDLDRS